MATNYPGSLDNNTNLPNPTGSNTQDNPDHASQHANINDAVKALETKVGITASTPTLNNLLVGTGVGTSTWSKPAPSGTILGTNDPQLVSNKTISTSTWNGGTITNPTLSTDAITGFTTSNTGNVYGVPIAAGVINGSSATFSGTVAISGNTSIGGTETVSGQISTQTAIAPPAAGSNTAGIKMSSTVNFGLYFGAGAPTFTAAQGSIYMNTTGSSTSTRIYVNTNGATTWTNVVTAI